MITPANSRLLRDPHSAWSPIDSSDWSHDSARHLALRLGFSQHPQIVEAVERMGPDGTVREWLGEIVSLPPPQDIVSMTADRPDYPGQMREASQAEREAARRALRRRMQDVYQDHAMGWYAFARDPRRSAQEKLVLFFENVWVVSFAGVRDAEALFRYQQAIRRHMGGSYPEMCKALAVEPAMVRYLNLDRNSRTSPNENFARELFELFCLGEGNYSETDIKEAARALTGYTVNRQNEVRLARQRFDSTQKTIFAETGNFDLPGVIDLVFRQPAAATFLPAELCSFYLTDEGVQPELIEALGEDWRQSDFSIPHLIRRFFSSRLFYDPAYRGCMIKSPAQFYLGLLQDLDLDVFPSPRRTSNLLRQMGQPFCNPPNVRGWVGGRRWINTATLAARRQLVDTLLRPVQLNGLNADERNAVAAAQQAGHGRFSVDIERSDFLHTKDPNKLGGMLAKRLHAVPDSDRMAVICAAVAEGLNGPRRAAACLGACLVDPAYNLC